MTDIVRGRTAVMAAAAVAFLAGSAGTAAAQETWTWNRGLAAGQTLEIKGINGAIRAQPASGGEVRVTAVKTARRGNVSTVNMEVVEHAGGVTICAVYPTPNSARRPNECRPGSEGSMSVQNNDVQVEFTVHVPRGVNFVARTVNGAVQARDLTGDVEARTVNGAIDVVTAGRARGGTVNGAVNVTMGRADWDISFETVNGAVTLYLPDNINANVRARTVNGGIETDFPLTVQGRFGRRSIEGTLGSGGRSLEVSTVNGGIFLRRAR
ncbi:MAG TPA: DUF4097 family beta strand repeat-containing protein [Longimicrobiales bacterium]|nr:DUF4097 family beta strand repeat-containing protein [Longimicrobiales bacterium]